MAELTEQQKQAVESIDSNVLVSAGAGSGKTHVLVERYIEILKRSLDAGLSGIVAVTYTRKAASEMRARLKMRMEGLMNEAENAEEKRRWSSLRAEVDGARIGTIHSLCESILKSYPAEAGTDPKFEVIDEVEMSDMLDESIEEAILQLVGEKLTEIDDLLRSFPVESIKGWVSTAIRSGSSFVNARKPLPMGADQDWSEHWRTELKELHETVVKELVTGPGWVRLVEGLQTNSLESGGGKVEELRVRLLALAEVAADGGRSPEERIQSLVAMVSFRLPGGKAKPEVKAVKEILKELKYLVAGSIDGVPLDLNESDSQSLVCLRALFSLLDEAREVYARSKQHRQVLDFNDLINKAYELLLAQGSSARAQFNQQLKAILVDEFQDTNRIQSELIAAMAGSSTRLFLIGDDKQSIYKFQGADVSTFDSWRSRMEGCSEDTGLDGDCRLASLTRSFRSHPHIVDFVNGVFYSLFSRGKDRPTYESRYQALESSRSELEGHSRIDAVVYDARNELGQRVSEESRRFEAARVADWILEKVSAACPVMDKAQGTSRKISFGDFAILVQRNQDFYPLERALAERRIPSVTMGGSSFLERQEIYDLENALRFLASPEDDHALVGVLRSPMFSVSDDLIHALASQAKSSLWQAMKENCDDDTSNPFFAATGLLLRWQKAAGTMPVPDVLRIVIESTRYDIVLLGLPDGKQRARNLLKLVCLSEDYKELSAGEFADRLCQMRQKSVKQTAAPVDSGNSVKLMTIHASKGLEFPAVVLPVMGVDAARVTGKLLFHSDYGIAFDCTRDEDEKKPASWEIARFREKKMAEAEKKRLLYVAMTRARDYLGLFIERGDRKVVSFREWLQSVLSIDTGESIAESGAKTLEGEGLVAPYELKVLDAQLMEDKTLPGLSVQPDELQDKGMSSDLVDLYDLRNPYGNVSWMHLERVTPSGGRVHLEEALVGSYFHLLMERLTHRLDAVSDELFADVALEREIGMAHPEVRAQLVAEGKKLIGQFQESSLFDLMSRARRRIHEAPYLAVDEDIVSSSGRPDLLLEDGGGIWHVIDFKTDKFDTGDIDRHAGEHRQQLLRYVRHIKELTGIDAIPSIYFARYGILHRI